MQLKLELLGNAFAPFTAAFASVAWRPGRSPETVYWSGMLTGGPGWATVAPMADLGQRGDIKHSSQSNYPIYFVFCAAEAIWSNWNARKTSGGCGGGELTAPYQDLWWRRDSFPSVRTWPLLSVFMPRDSTLVARQSSSLWISESLLHSRFCSRLKKILPSTLVE